MREIVLDTETTGIDPASGHRIVEIGAVELINHLPTGQTFHVYLNPERAVPAEAVAIHGLSDDFLKDKPLFAAVAADFIAFIGEAPLIIHNAGFDMKFLNAELGWLGLPELVMERATDTLAMARRRHPMAPNSLDALCKRYGIDNSRREKHGALLDAELLAEVYLELIGGRQTAMTLAPEPVRAPALAAAARQNPLARPVALPPRFTAAEAEAHEALVKALGPQALWNKFHTSQ